MATTTALPTDAIKGVTLVGQVVTYFDQMYKVHSVEGPTWYTFNDQGTTRLDTGFPHSEWHETPMATIVPLGSKIGDGVSLEVPLQSKWLRRGVNLAKH